MVQARGSTQAPTQGVPLAFDVTVRPLGSTTRAIVHLRTAGTYDVTVSDRVAGPAVAGAARHAVEHAHEARLLGDTAARCYAPACAVATCWLGSPAVPVADSA